MKFSRVYFFVVLLVSGSVALGQAEGQAKQQRTLEPAAQAYIYWTNSANGSVGRAKINGTDANEKFIPSTTGGAAGGAGLTTNKQYLYWTSANGGSATTILRANSTAATWTRSSSQA